MTLVWMALQALEATQNIMVVQNLGVMVDIIVWKDICKKVSLYNAPRAQYSKLVSPRSYIALLLTGFPCGSQ